MSPAREQRKKKFAPAEDLAPHVDPEWTREFTLELTLRNVAGQDIGAALAEVDSHCAESGEAVEAAFGPARDYAASLDLPASAEPQGSALKAGIPVVGQLLGMMLMIWAAPGVGAGRPAEVSAGMLVIFALVAVFIIAVNWKAGAVTGFVARHRLLSFAMMMLFLALLALQAFLLRETVAELPSSVLLLMGTAVLVVATAAEYLRSRSSGYTGDVLATPLEDREEVDRRRRTLRRADYTRIFIMPVFAAAMTAVLAFFGAIS